MKIKILGIFLIICSMLILLQITVLGYENVDNYKNNSLTYELFDDGTAKITLIENDLINKSIRIDEEILYNGKTYKVTTISSNAFNGITEEHELQMYCDVSPKLESSNSFDNISAIYVPLGAKGYTQENGWEKEKLKNYKITQQPQDITVTAGEIKDIDILEAVANIPALTSGSSILYSWYECDKDGNITNKKEISNYNEYKIPTDLSYDNENNTSKKYYYVCVIGKNDDILESTRVVEVTVNLGTYKVYFNSGSFANWTNGTTQNSIIVPVNSERKIEKSDIPSIDNLKPLGKGVTFVGWSIDEENVINDLSTIIFDKNTTLLPIWQYTVNFDANGGSFSNGNSILEFVTTYYDFEIYDSIMDIKNPTREGYEFLGFFDEKEGGTSLEYYLAEDGIYEEKTFYARWKETEKQNNTPNVEDNTTDTKNENTDNNTSNPESTNSNNNEKTEINNNSVETTNPQTSDNISLFVGILVISILGIFVTTKFKNIIKNK